MGKRSTYFVGIRCKVLMLSQMKKIHNTAQYSAEEYFSSNSPSTINILQVSEILLISTFVF